jgi:hypothetical protein
MLELEEITIKLSAKIGHPASTIPYVWGVGLPLSFLKRHPEIRAKIRAERNGRLSIILNVTGVKFGSTGSSTLGWANVGQRHIEGLGLPSKTVNAIKVKASFNSKTKILTVDRTNLPQVFKESITRFKDLRDEVKSHQPEHSPEEFQNLVIEGRGTDRIGDHEAMSVAFQHSKRPIDALIGQIEGEDDTWSDTAVRELKNQLNSMKKRRPDIVINIQDDEFRFHKRITTSVEI